MLHMVMQYTAVTRQTPAAKSHPSGSNTLYLVPVEHLRNLVATHPAAVGVECSYHVTYALIHNVPIWAVAPIARYAMYKTCRTSQSVLLFHLLPKVLSWCVLVWLYKLALLAALPHPSDKAAAASHFRECML